MKGQVWIETTLYALIGLALIGMVLAFVTPKIAAAQEKVMIEQTISSLQSFDNIIFDVSTQGPGNRRTYEIKFNRGELEFDTKNSTVTFKFDNLKGKYSQINSSIKMGAVGVLTLAQQKNYAVYLTLNYNSSVQFTINDKNDSKAYSAAPTSYRFVVSNEGSYGTKTLIDVSEIS